MIIPYYECRPNLVPEDSVTPETQTLVVFKRRKGCVGRLKKFYFLKALLIIIIINRSKKRMNII